MADNTDQNQDQGPSSLEQERELYSQMDDAINAADESTGDAAAAGDKPAGDQGAEGAPADEGAGDEGGEGEGGRVVPLKVVQEERRKRQEAERKAAETEQKAREDREYRIRMEERQKIAREEDERQRQAEAAKQQQQPDPNFGLGPRPDQEQNPVDALEWDEKFRTKQIEAANKRADDAVAAANQAAVVSQMNSERLEFIQSNPDYQEAINYAVKQRQDYYTEELGLSLNDANAMIAQETMTLVNIARSRGKNAASALYNFAKKQGYKKAEAAPAAKPAEEKKGDTPEERVAKQEQGSKIRSIGGGGSSSTVSSPIDEGSIDNMSTAEFRTWYNQKGNAERYRKMMLGADA